MTVRNTGDVSSAGEITPARATALLDELTAVVAHAAIATLKRPASQVERRIKSDQTPVTEADEAAEAAILQGLARLLPGVPVVSEESLARAPTTLGISAVIVDPLDGTKEFLAGRDEFTVNVGIVTRGQAIAGLIAAPAQGWLWRGVVGDKAERLRMRWADGHILEQGVIHTRAAPQKLVVEISRSHLDEATEKFLARLPIAEHHQCGSSVKFCQLAQGDADLYPRLSPTHEWDIAAGCAILAAAGGRVTDAQGRPLRFGQSEKNYLVPGFLAWGDPTQAAAKT